MSQAKYIYCRKIPREFLSRCLMRDENFEEQLRISLFSAPNDKIFTTQIKPLKQS